jgi:hypothetical protein
MDSTGTILFNNNRRNAYKDSNGEETDEAISLFFHFYHQQDIYFDLPF